MTHEEIALIVTAVNEKAQALLAEAARDETYLSENMAYEIASKFTAFSPREKIYKLLKEIQTAPGYPSK